MKEPLKTDVYGVMIVSYPVTQNSAEVVKHYTAKGWFYADKYFNELDGVDCYDYKFSKDY